MITYVDTSTLLKLIIEEPGSDQAEVIWDAADALVVARIGYVEARAALAAAQRDGRLGGARHREAIRALDLLWAQLSVVEVTAEVIDRAVVVAEDRGLRGYDAVHLASALMSGVDVFSSADRRLCEAAGASGLHVANPTDVAGAALPGDAARALEIRDRF